jgi:hypothetical protein
VADSSGVEVEEIEAEFVGFSPELGKDWNGGGGQWPWRQ